MIGDWVHSLQTDVDTKITNIETDGEDAVWLSDLSTFGRQFMNEIQPIPLTEEILKKNNILYQWGYPWYQGIYDEEGIEVHFAEYCQMHLKYVHELQHALRLLHFDIEIKL